MAGSLPGPTGTDGGTPVVDGGTLALTATPVTEPVGGTPTPPTAGAPPSTAPAAETTDPAIEALNLIGAAKKGAYALKKAHPSVTFTSGKRDKEGQARAMAPNVVANRKWIEETYKPPTTISKACQKWVDDNAEKTTAADIQEGLLSVLNDHTEAQLALLSKHLSGEAFDVQPVETDADAIKKSIRELEGLGRFLEKEGGLVRWHAQF
jgi:hypothetical protein